MRSHLSYLITDFCVVKLYPLFNQYLKLIEITLSTSKLFNELHSYRESLNIETMIIIEIT